jgi:hypothetical protein
MSVAVMSQPDSSAAATEHRRRLNRKLRAAFIEGAEEQSRKDQGRGLTADELARIMPQYPGDMPER